MLPAFVFIIIVVFLFRNLRKKPKKKKQKSSGIVTFMVIFAIFMFVAVTSPNQKENGTNETVPSIASISATPHPTKIPTPTTVTQTQTPSPTGTLMPTPKVDIGKLKAELEDAGSGFDFCAVEGDETGFIINLGINGLINDVTAAKMMGYDETYSMWKEIKSNMLALYNQTYNLLKSAGMETPALSIMLVNDENTDNVLLGITYGAVIYDIMEE